MLPREGRSWPDVGPLDKFSIQFGEALFAAFPDWRRFARADRDDHNPDGFLVVEVRAPDVSDLAHPLAIYTENGEVTIAMDSWHQHFNWPSEYGSEDPLNFLQSLLAEEIAVVSWWNQDKWMGSTTCARDEVPSSPESFGVATSMRVRSWRGALNRDVNL